MGSILDKYKLRNYEICDWNYPGTIVVGYIMAYLFNCKNNGRGICYDSSRGSKYRPMDGIGLAVPLHHVNT